MSNFMILGIIVLFACYALSRFISEKGLKTLNSEQKVALVDEFSNQRKYSFIPIAIILVAYLIIIQLQSEHITFYYFLFLLALIIILAIMHFITSKKLHKLNLPKSYLKFYTVSRIVNYFGLGIFLGAIIIGTI